MSAIPQIKFAVNANSNVGSKTIQKRNVRQKTSCSKLPSI